MFRGKKRAMVQCMGFEFDGRLMQKVIFLSDFQGNAISLIHINKYEKKRFIFIPTRRRRYLDVLLH